MGSLGAGSQRCRLGNWLDHRTGHPSWASRLQAVRVSSSGPITFHHQRLHQSLWAWKVLGVFGVGLGPDQCTFCLSSKLVHVSCERSVVSNSLRPHGL